MPTHKGTILRVSIKDNLRRYLDQKGMGTKGSQQAEYNDWSQPSEAQQMYKKAQDAPRSFRIPCALGAHWCASVCLIEVRRN